MDILESILSHGKSSRLYQSFVYDQKISLAVGAEYSLMQTDPGLFYFYALVSPGQKVEVVEEALHKEIKRLQADPPTEQELQRAKNQVEAARSSNRTPTSGMPCCSDRQSPSAQGGAKSTSLSNGSEQ